jgi:hypothetical protein
MFWKHSRWALGFYVVGWLALGSAIAAGDRPLSLAFMVACGTMLDIRIARLA